jgi:hypothetical protein
VGFAVIQTTLDGCADARRNRRIADIEVERHVGATGAGGDGLQCFGGDRADALPVDIFHREDMYP